MNKARLTVTNIANEDVITTSATPCKSTALHYNMTGLSGSMYMSDGSGNMTYINVVSITASDWSSYRTDTSEETPNGWYYLSTSGGTKWYKCTDDHIIQ